MSHWIRAVKVASKVIVCVGNARTYPKHTSLYFTTMTCEKVCLGSKKQIFAGEYILLDRKNLKTSYVISNYNRYYLADKYMMVCVRLTFFPLLKWQNRGSIITELLYP